MGGAEAALIGEIIKAGFGWLLAAYFYWQLTNERKDRRECDDRTVALMLSLKDESHTRVQEANNRQAESFSKVGDALVALSSEVRAIKCRGT